MLIVSIKFLFYYTGGDKKKQKKKTKGVETRTAIFKEFSFSICKLQNYYSFFFFFFSGWVGMLFNKESLEVLYKWQKMTMF